jgi:hypothetical protein
LWIHTFTCLSSLVGWEDGSRSPPRFLDCWCLSASICASVPTFVVFECRWMRRSWRVGMWVSSFPLSVDVVALGCLSYRSLSSSPSGVASCFSIVELILGRCGGLREVGSGGLRKRGPFPRADNGCVVRNVPHLIGGVVSASVHLSHQAKAWSAPLRADG